MEAGGQEGTPGREGRGSHSRPSPKTPAGTMSGAGRKNLLTRRCYSLAKPVGTHPEKVAWKWIIFAFLDRTATSGIKQEYKKKKKR